MATAQKITELYNQYMGFSPSSADVSKFSMMSPADVEDTLKNTKKDVQSEATKKAQSAIANLGGGDYASNMAKAQDEIARSYGLPEMEQQMIKSQDWANQVANKGPLLETTMKGLLGQESPTFLGISKKSLEEKFGGVQNPFVRERMVNAYLGAADKSMTSTLNALNSLYKTSLTAAQNAADLDAKRYGVVAEKVKDLYGELQWINRERYQESISGGNVSVVDERNKREALAGMLDAIPLAGSKEAALKELENTKMSTILKVGEGGYNQILNEINRIYPDTMTTPTSSQGKSPISKIGKAVQSLQAQKPNALNVIPAVSAFNTAKTFFTSLFGE